MEEVKTKIISSREKYSNDTNCLSLSDLIKKTNHLEYDIEYDIRRSPILTSRCNLREDMLLMFFLVLCMCGYLVVMYYL
jgi:hypothetical protein